MEYCLSLAHSATMLDKKWQKEEKRWLEKYIKITERFLVWAEASVIHKGKRGRGTTIYHGCQLMVANLLKLNSLSIKSI